MKQRTKLIQVALLAMSSFSFLAGCTSGNEVVGIKMTDTETISVYYGNFSSNGIKVDVQLRNGTTRTIDLTDDMISDVERLKFFKMGEQSIEVNYREKFTTTMPVNVIFNEFPDTYKLIGSQCDYDEEKGYYCVYDGNPHMITLNQELPEGAIITYPSGNIFTNVGEYNVTGVISKKGYGSKTLNAKLTIEPAERDSSGITFSDVTVIYDGESHTIEAQNIPEGIKVEYQYFNLDDDYEVPKINNAGKYKIVASFIDSSTNYKKIPDKEAFLTIEKARYDVRGVEFHDHTKTYDGNDYLAEKSISGLDTLPGNLRESVSYIYLNESGEEVRSNEDVGTYTMVAKFGGIDEVNYYPIEDMTATLKVVQEVVSIKDLVAFNGINAEFNPENPNITYSLKITDPTDPEKEAKLPAGVKVEYINNEQVYAGEHEVKAVFTCEDPNKTPDVTELVAYIVINRGRDSVKFMDEEGEYTQAFSFDKYVKINGTQASVFGFDPAVYRLKPKEITVTEIDPTTQKEIEKTITVTIAFFDSDDNYVAPENLQVYSEENPVGYTYVVGFEYIDENMNNSVLLSEETDGFKYDGAGA